jgi:hypothetical protein
MNKILTVLLLISAGYAAAKAPDSCKTACQKEIEGNKMALLAIPTLNFDLMHIDWNKKLQECETNCKK